jgi:hypothetical protein
MKLVGMAFAMVIFAFGSAAQACSFGGAGLFEIAPESWELHPGPAQKGLVGDYWEKVPTPTIRGLKVTRGTESAGSSCADAGTIAFTVSLPRGSSYSIEDFGVYFRVKRGTLPDEIFPDLPMTGETNNKRMYSFILAWLDGHPSGQSPIDVDVEIFFVSKGLHIGPSTVIRIQSD